MSRDLPARLLNSILSHNPLPSLLSICQWTRDLDLPLVDLWKHGTWFTTHLFSFNPKGPGGLNPTGGSIRHSTLCMRRV